MLGFLTQDRTNNLNCESKQGSCRAFCVVEDLKENVSVDVPGVLIRADKYGKVIQKHDLFVVCLNV